MQEESPTEFDDVLKGADLSSKVSPSLIRWQTKTRTKVRPQSANSWNRRSELRKRPQQAEQSQELSRAARKSEGPHRLPPKRETQSFVRSGMKGVQSGAHAESEFLSLKHSLNTLKVENGRLKAQLHKAQKEGESRAVCIRELQARSTVPAAAPAPGRGESQIVRGLRLQIRELGAEVRKARAEKESVVKATRTTRLQEAQAELRVATEECKRLRNMLELAVRQQLPADEPDESKEQRVLIRKLALENQELLSTVQKQEQEIAHWKDLAKQRRIRRKVAIKQAGKHAVDSGEERAPVANRSSSGKKEPPLEASRYIEKEIRLLKENMSKYGGEIEQLKRSKKRLAEVPRVKEEDAKEAAAGLRLALMNAKVGREELKSVSLWRLRIW